MDSLPIWVRSDTMEEDDAVRVPIEGSLESLYIADVLRLALDELNPSSCFPALFNSAWLSSIGSPSQHSSTRQKSEDSERSTSLAASAGVFRVKVSDVECLNARTGEKLSNRTSIKTLMRALPLSSGGLDLIVRPKPQDQNKIKSAEQTKSTSGLASSTLAVIGGAAADNTPEPKDPFQFRRTRDQSPPLAASRDTAPHERQSRPQQRQGVNEPYWNRNRSTTPKASSRPVYSKTPPSSKLKEETAVGEHRTVSSSAQRSPRPGTFGTSYLGTPYGKKESYKHVESKVKQHMAPPSAAGTANSSGHTVSSFLKTNSKRDPSVGSSTGSMEEENDDDDLVGGPCPKFEALWGRQQVCRRRDWNKASHDRAGRNGGDQSRIGPSPGSSTQKHATVISPVQSPTVRTRTPVGIRVNLKSSPTSSERQRPNSARTGVSSPRQNSKKRSKSPPPPPSPKGDNGLQPKLAPSFELTSPSAAEVPSTAKLNAAGTERTWKTQLNDFADAASPVRPNNQRGPVPISLGGSSHLTVDGGKDGDRALSPSGRRRSVQFNESAEIVEGSPKKQNSSPSPTRRGSSQSPPRHDSPRRKKVNQDKNQRDDLTNPVGQEEEKDNSGGQLDMNYQFPPPGGMGGHHEEADALEDEEDEISSSSPQPGSPQGLKMTASLLEQHNSRNSRERSLKNPGQGDRFHQDETAATVNAPAGTEGLSLLEQYELHQQQKRKQMQEQQQAQQEASSHANRSNYARRRQSVGVPSVIFSKDLILSVEMTSAIPSFGGSAADAMAAARYSVRACWTVLVSYCDLPSMLAVAACSKSARVLWQPPALVLARALVSLEALSNPLTPRYHEALVKYVLESQTTISRDVFRVVNVVCEIARGSRCSTFEDCTSTLQQPTFLSKLLSIETNSMSQVSRDANAAVLKRVNQSSLPPIMHPICEYLLALIGLNKRVQGAKKYLDNLGEN